MLKEKKRSMDVDNISAEALKNNHVVAVIHKLCNMCYRSGKVPNVWGKSFICPIPICTISEPRDPLSYRGIVITTVAYKVYCTLLNNLVTSWCEHNKIILRARMDSGESAVQRIT